MRFNLLRGLTGHDTPPAPADAAGARSRAASAPPASLPTQRPRAPGARATCAQLLRRARDTAATAVRTAGPGKEAPPPRLPVVGPNTTVFDTVAWNSGKPPADVGNILVLGRPQRTGDPRLGPAQVQGHAVALDLHADPRVPADADAIRQGRDAVMSILGNTEREYALTGTHAGRVIDHARDWLAQPGCRVTARDLGAIMKSVGEAIHLQTVGTLGASREERTAGRMPMECMTHLGHQIRAAMRTADPVQRRYLHNLGAETMGRVLRHDLSFASTQNFLQEVQAGCQRAGLGALAELAGELGSQIPSADKAGDHATRLHDNIYGRAMETVLMAELVRQPPASVGAAMDAMAQQLLETLEALTPDDQEKVAGRVLEMVQAERRSWQTESPKLEAFAQAPYGADALRALKSLLSQPARNGADCLAIPYLTVKLSLKLDQIRPAPWMAAANANYTGVVGPASARETRAFNPNRMSRKAGVTAHHQPPIAWSSEPAMHPADRNIPLLNKPSPELTQALQHGVPFVSGVSGSTNIAMHMVDHMLRNGKTVDARDALLGTMMFLTHDGGHSMHEAMWVGNQLEQTRGLPLGLGAVPRPISWPITSISSVDSRPTRAAPPSTPPSTRRGMRR
ncbi:hypothetical protein [Pseudoduganella plicata]|uniref:Type III effector protein n=1 Tax=Pseudoduganella plicata TaxID=321984 RepID=A0ABX5S7B4_9BURK|nr:hypothetical protein [Pseudoduganella plicata]QBQ35442.1 hypothetical protein E1742_04130 [Pseudoduganella plicata]